MTKPFEFATFSADFYKQEIETLEEEILNLENHRKDLNNDIDDEIDDIREMIREYRGFLNQPGEDEEA